jgi:hypothetical protein
MAAPVTATPVKEPFLSVECCIKKYKRIYQKIKY